MFSFRAGENQALRLGRKLRRDAYPDVSGTYKVATLQKRLSPRFGVGLFDTNSHLQFGVLLGGRILRLHSTFRHDLKIKTSYVRLTAFSTHTKKELGSETKRFDSVASNRFVSVLTSARHFQVFRQLALNLTQLYSIPC